MNSQTTLSFVRIALENPCENIPEITYENDLGEAVIIIEQMIIPDTEDIENFTVVIENYICDFTTI